MNKLPNKIRPMERWSKVIKDASPYVSPTEVNMQAIAAEVMSIEDKLNAIIEYLLEKEKKV